MMAAWKSNFDIIVLFLEAGANTEYIYNHDTFAKLCGRKMTLLLQDRGLLEPYYSLRS